MSAGRAVGCRSPDGTHPAVGWMFFVASTVGGFCRASANPPGHGSRNSAHPTSRQKRLYVRASPMAKRPGLLDSLSRLCLRPSRTAGAGGAGVPGGAGASLCLVARPRECGALAFSTSISTWSDVTAGAGDNSAVIAASCRQ